MDSSSGVVFRGSQAKIEASGTATKSFMLAVSAPKLCVHDTAHVSRPQAHAMRHADSVALSSPVKVVGLQHCLAVDGDGAKGIDTS